MYGIGSKIGMKASDIQRIVKNEISRAEAFDNSHGITPRNLREFLVEPFCVSADPDDAASRPRDMWVVLQERPGRAEDYAIVMTHNWAAGVLSSAPRNVTSRFVPKNSLAAALTAM